MRILRPSLLFLFLIVLSSSSFCYSQWLPDDWTLEKGSADTCLYTINTPSCDGFLKLESSFGSTSSKIWNPQSDFLITPERFGYSFSSTYRQSRFKLAMKGELRKIDGDGIYFSFCFVPDSEMDSLLLNFTITKGDFFGKYYSVNGAMPVTLTEEVQSIRANRIVLAEGDPSQLVINTSSKLSWQIAKRETGGLELSVDACGGTKIFPGIPLFFTARISARDFTPAPFCSVIHPLSSNTIERYSPYEAAFQTLGVAVKNPYDLNNIDAQALFADAEGNRTSVRAVYYSPHTEVSIDGKKQIIPTGRPYFLLRYTPRNSGKYYLRTYLKNENKHYSSKILQFDCTDSGNGFTIVSPANKKFFQLSSGEHFFPIGHNLAWLHSQLPSTYRAKLKKMASSGINCTRIWISTWGINVDDSKSPLGFNQKALHLLDSIMESAHEFGIKVILVLTNHEDLNNKKNLLPFFGKNPDEHKTIDFFSDKKLVDSYMTRISYLTHRYSPYSSLMAFETGNELDYSLENLVDLAKWNKKVATTIRNNDVNRHLITTSLGYNAFDADYYRNSGVDFGQFHIYFNSLAYIKSDIEKSADSLLASFIDRANSLDMPFYSAEFGYSQSADSQSLNEIDKKGILLSNSLWSSLFSGMSGGAMNWWWDSYLIKNNFDGCYSHFSKYLSNVDFVRENFKYSNEKLRTCKLSIMRGSSMILARISSDDNNWVDLVASQTSPVVNKGQEVTFRNLPRSFCRIQWWNTSTGMIVNEYTIAISQGDLTLKSPSFSRDIALKILFERCE